MPAAAKAPTKTAAEIDAWEARVISEATIWTAFIQHAPGNRESKTFDSFSKARISAEVGAKQLNRRIMVYAENAVGRSVMVGSVRPNGEFVKAVACDLPES